MYDLSARVFEHVKLAEALTDRLTLTISPVLGHTAQAMELQII